MHIRQLGNGNLHLYPRNDLCTLPIHLLNEYLTVYVDLLGALLDMVKVTYIFHYIFVLFQHSGKKNVLLNFMKMIIKVPTNGFQQVVTLSYKAYTD